MLGKWAALNCFFLAFSAAPAASSEAMRGRWEQGKERNGDAGGARACPRPRTVAANPRASAGGTLTKRIQIQVGIHTRHPGLLQRPDRRHRAASMD